MMTLPKSGWPVRGHTEVNSVAVRVTAWISGAGKASALRYSRASPGVDGRGSGPVRGSLGFCSFIDRAPQLISVCFHDHSCTFGNVMTSPATRPVDPGDPLRHDESQAEGHRALEWWDRLDHYARARPTTGVRGL